LPEVDVPSPEVAVTLGVVFVLTDAAGSLASSAKADPAVRHK